ncbi:hypothetical protein [Devosia aquimaris]|uniref:hypothetical protein n=1 Tax=Devosia aquimaris TaxID=2866214 RepID=UPI001CD0892E|nr:hypothetical protein [Devosia sp. CJK-A8-3]
MAVINQSQIDSLRLGIDSAFNAIEQALRVQVFAEKLPLIGDELSSAFDSAETALHHIQAIKQTLFTTLSTFNNAADYAETLVEQAINNALAQYGLGNLGTIVDAVVSGGNVQLNFSSDKTYTYTQALESDLGLGALNVHTDGSATASIHYAFDLGVGVDANGFYVDTSAADELSIDLSVSGANLSAGADVGFLSFNATDQGSTLTANLDINLKDGDNRLRIAELGNDLLDASVQGAADINIHLTGDMGSAAYPSMSADLNVDWAFGAGTVVNPGDDNSSFGSRPTIAFNNVEYDLGSFLNDFVLPVLDQLEPILRPLDMALSVLTSDIKMLKLIPGWSAIFDKTGAVVNGQDVPDGKITLLDFLKMGDQDMDLAAVITAMEIIDEVVDWVDFLTLTPLTSVNYGIGGFEITEDIRNAATVLANATPHVTAAAGNLLDAIADLDDGQTDVSGSSILTAMVGSTHFALPILENPLSAFGLLLGKNVDLFTLQLPHVELGISDVELASVPILPALDVKLFGSLGIAFDLAMGFDTRGLAQFAATGFSNYGTIVNGFYLNDFGLDGNERPEITFEVSLDLIVALDAWIAEVGGGGGITGEIFFDLADQLWTQGAAPGRIYLDTMAQALADNPFGIFETSGRITAGLTAYAKAFGIEVWRINSPRATLGSFSFSDNPSTGGDGETPPPPPGLGDMSGSTLLLNIGTRAGERDITDKVDDGESFEVTGGSGVTVNAFGRTQSFAGVTLIQADGGAGNDDIVIAEDLAIASELRGGAGDDTLLGGAATDTLYGDAGRDFLEGAGGVDHLYGGTEDDILVGGAGADVLDGGDGRDIASYYASASGVTINLATGVNTGGDAQGDTLTDIEVVEGSSHNDHLTGGTASDSLVGLGGDDELYGGDNNDVLAGNDGNDILDGGLGQDVLIGGKGDDTYHVDDAGDEVQENRLNEIGSGEDGGHDHVIASLDWSLDTPDQQVIEDLTLVGSALAGTGNALANTINGNASGNTLHGLAGEDRLYGHAGNDTLYGDDDADLLDGGDDDDTLYGDAGMDELIGGGGNDTLDGGADNDTMTGGIGDDIYYVDAFPDIIHEWDDEGLDTVRARNNYALGVGVSVELLETANSSGTQAIELEGNEKSQIIRGNDGNNILDGRAGADALIGGGGIDTVTYRNSGAGVTINLNLASQFGGEAEGDTYDSIEIVEGSSHSDTLHGTATANHLRGIGGQDYLYGYAGDDTLVGGSGNDFLYGGEGNDTMVGGQGDDTYYVDSLLDVVDDSSDDGDGTDIIYASLSYSIAGNSSIENLTITGSATHATGNSGSNTIVGNGLDNVIDGREGADHMAGGQGDDTYYVDNQSDTVEELADEGIDTIYATTQTMAFATQQIPDPLIDYTLNTWGAQVENFIVTDNAWRINITGNALDNVIVGNTRSNVIYGLAGNDDLWAGAAGADTLNGGGDDDTGHFHLGYTPGTYDVQDTFNGGDGIDTLDMDWTNTVHGIRYVGSGASGYYETFVPSVGSYTYMVFSDTERFKLTGGSGDDDLWGGDYEDVLKGNAGNDRLMGGAGKGTYHGGAGVDMVTAVIASAQGLDFVLRLADTQAGEVVVNAGTAIETRWEGIEVARLTTGAGNDTLDARGLPLNTDTGMRGYGFDLFDAGAGNDTFAVDINSLGSHLFQGGDGIDTLIMDWSGTSQNITFVGAATPYYSVFWAPGGYYQSVSYSSVERFELTGGSADDDLYGSDLDDILIGNAGNDRLVGGTGKGSYLGGAGVDLASATIASAAGLNFTLRLADTQAGTVTVNAGTAIETHWQGIEVARLVLGAGNDTLDVRGLGAVYTDTRSFGSHLFDAGAGDDTFAVDYDAFGSHLFKGGDGVDTLVMDWSKANADVTFNAAGSYYSVFYPTYGSYGYVSFTDTERFQLTGGSGNDLLVGGALDDTLIGGAGSDRIEGGTGKGVYDGGDGLDVVFATDLSAVGQNFRLNLAAAQTTAQITNAGKSREVSWKGVEVLQVTLGAGDDEIDAQGIVGNMRIRGVSGHTIDGGAGNDTFKIDLGSTGSHMFAGGDGIDTLVMNWSAATESISYYGTYYSVYVAAEGTYTTMAFSGIEQYRLTGGAGNDRLVGGASYDELRGGGGVDLLELGAGRGLADGSSGLDLVRASDLSAAGEDFVLSLAEAQSIARITNAGTGRQVTWRAVEVLDITLGAGNDTVDTRGVGGNMRIHGVGGHTIRAGDGNDSFAVDLGATGDHVFQGDGGTDTLIMDWSTANFAIGYSGGVPGSGSYNTFISSEGTYTSVSFSSVEKFVLTGGNGDDRLFGGALYDELRGGNGTDRLDGGAGGGIYDGGAGTDLVLATDLSAVGQNFILDLSDAQVAAQLTNAGTDREVSWKSVEVLQITTGAGDDTLDARGIAANLRIHGVGGHRFDAGDGNDRFAIDIGSTGAHQFIGGAGVDTLVLDWSGAQHDIYGGGGVTDGGFETFVSAEGSYTSVSYSGVERFEISGNGQANTFTGLALDDILRGNGGNDTLRGGAGADKLYGGADNDTLIGGAGNDLLDGGDGLDTAVFSGAFSDYLIDYRSRTITDLRGSSPDGADTFDTSLERLQFTDRLVDLTSYRPDVTTDMNGNLIADVVAVSNTGALTFRDGWGNTAPQSAGTLGANTVLGVGDFNGDGSDSVLYRTASGSTYYRSADGTTTSVGNLAGQSVVAIGDFNGDGTDDILLRKDASGWFAFLNSGSTYSGMGYRNGQTLIATGDFNGDGKEDMLFESDTSGWLSYARGGDLANINVGFRPGQDLMAIGDFNGDGRDDALFRSTTSGWMSYARDGNGANVNYGYRTGQELLGAGDFDGDGAMDLLFKRTTGGWLSYMQGDTGINVNIGFATGKTLAGIDDFDGDGKADILFINDATHQASFMSAASSSAVVVLGDFSGQTVLSDLGIGLGDDMLIA